MIQHRSPGAFVRSSSESQDSSSLHDKVKNQDSLLYASPLFQNAVSPDANVACLSARKSRAAVRAIERESTSPAACSAASTGLILGSPEDDAEGVVHAVSPQNKLYIEVKVVIGLALVWVRVKVV